MSLMINSNVTALNAWRNLNKTDRSMSATMEKLSSGLRINKAADDPAGLVVSEQMRAQVVGLKAAVKNSEKGISMIQTAEAALDKVHALLDKMRGLALDSANTATSDTTMLAANQAEVSNIIETITRISDNTQYGTKALLDGSNEVALGTLTADASISALANASVAGDWAVSVAANGANFDATVTLDGNTVELQASVAAGSTVTFTDGTNSIDVTFGGTLTGGHTASATATGAALDFQVGANANQTVSISIGSVSATTLGISAVDVSTDAQGAIGLIDTAIDTVSRLRGTLGAFQANTLEANLDNLRVAAENLQASESVIRDADMAAEMATFTKYQIMLQAGTAMLAQANQMPQSILQLLR